MATIPYQQFTFGGSFIIIWDGINSSTSDVCQAFMGLEWMDKTVQINGSAVTNVVLAGTNDSRVFNQVAATGFDSAVTLTDATTGTGISVSASTNAAGMFVVKENPLAIFPIVTTGTKVVVRLTCAKKR